MPRRCGNRCARPASWTRDHRFTCQRVPHKLVAGEGSQMVATSPTPSRGGGAPLQGKRPDLDYSPLAGPCKRTCGDRGCRNQPRKRHSGCLRGVFRQDVHNRVDGPLHSPRCREIASECNRPGVVKDRAGASSSSLETGTHALGPDPTAGAPKGPQGPRGAARSPSAGGAAAAGTARATRTARRSAVAA